MMFAITLMITTHQEKGKLIVFNDMIADIMTDKNLSAIIKQLFIGCRK